ncbi:MAG: hypothetical protein M4579_007430 [Chaenotheca gracillima]|nr:MAG: hypothetical protein M4579_007430 [Chaenotheca gracillima]
MSARNLPDSFLSFRDFLSSPTFALRPGHSKTQYKVHHALLASKSDALFAACNNGMKETGQRRMDLPDVSEDVLVSFLEWAYTGDYNSDWNHKIPWGRGVTSTNENYAISNETVTSLDDNFSPAEPLPNESIVEYEAQSEDAPEKGISCPEDLDLEKLLLRNDPIHPLLLHVRLYIFADMYLVRALTPLVYEKIYRDLETLDLTKSKRNKNIAIGVLMHAFENLPETDDLVSWLGRYAAFKLPDLRTRRSRFEELLRSSDGRFAAQVLQNFDSNCKSPWDNSEEFDIGCEKCGFHM